jgi:hypothetical protein
MNLTASDKARIQWLGARASHKASDHLHRRYVLAVAHDLAAETKRKGVEMEPRLPLFEGNT